MFKNSSFKVEQINAAIDTRHCYSIQDARLIHVKGKGALKKKMTYAKNTKEHDIEEQLCLNEIPLVQYNSQYCPTCANWVATGHGIETAASSKWIKTIQKMNEPFVSLDDSIQKLTPILQLLESGLYLIADVVCYPTDGTGKFFWAASNEMTINHATTEWFQCDTRLEYITPEPIYLYPSQNVDCYNKKRVEYYLQQFQQTKVLPYAVIYNFCEGLSVLLDGHHKACAAALLGIPLSCVAIIPYQGRIDQKCCFSDIGIDAAQIPQKYLPHQKVDFDKKNINDAAGKLGQRNWEKEYQDSVKQYPTIEAYSFMKAANIQWKDFSNEEIEKCLQEHTFENEYKIEALLYALSFRKDPRLKAIAFRYLEWGGSHIAYELLSQLKNDAEVEQLFIDYLVNSEDKTDPILSIIHGYWDK